MSASPPRRRTAVAVLAGLAALSVLGGCDRLRPGAVLPAVAGFESRCESLPAARFDVVTAPVEAKEDYSLAYVEIARLAEPSSAQHRTVGLTHAKFGYRSTLDLEGLEDSRRGRVCARARVRVEVTTAPMTVYVAREYRGDSCREPLIVEHERRHVDVFETYAAESASRLARELDQKIGGAVRYASTMAEAQQAIRAELTAHLEAFMAEARAELAIRHAAIDTPEEYEKLARECGPTR